MARKGRKWTKAQKAAASRRMKAAHRAGKYGRGRRKGAAKPKTACKKRRPTHGAAYAGVVGAGPKKKRRKGKSRKIVGYVGVTSGDLTALRRVQKRFGSRVLRKLGKHRK